jgi:hypothetical protein
MSRKQENPGSEQSSKATNRQLKDDQLKSTSELDDSKLDSVTGGAGVYDIVKNAMDSRVKDLQAAQNLELARSSGCLGATDSRFR